MNLQNHLQSVNHQIKETKEEIEILWRNLKGLEMRVADLLAQKVQLEDAVCIDVDEETENNSIDQDKKFEFPDLTYRVVSDD